MKEFISQWAWQLPEFLPEEIRNTQSLVDLPQAINQAHFPDDEESKNKGRTRLAFNELFLLQLGVLSKKRAWQEGQKGISLRTDASLLKAFIDSLPFKLTGAQNSAIKEILADLAKTQPMSRLLQGDVGSGKTVVATAALLITATNGYQSAIMAPTEILAGQHFNTISQLLSKAGTIEKKEDYQFTVSGLLSKSITIALLVGDVCAEKKRKSRKRSLTDT